MKLQFLTCFACVDVGTGGSPGPGGEFRDRSPAAGDLLSADTTTKKYGAASLKVHRDSEGDITEDYLTEPCLSSANDQALGFWVYVPSGRFPTSSFVTLFGWDTSGYCALGSDQKLRILNQGGSVVATMTGTLTADTWYWVVLRMNCRWTGFDGTDFWLRLYDDEGTLVEEISVTAHGSLPMLVVMGQRLVVGSTVYFTHHLDGGYGVSDGWPPICPAFVDGIVPTGAGNYAELDIYPDTGEDPYEDVDDVPDDADSTYLYRDVAGTCLHTFVHGASGIPGGSNVLAVGLRAMSRATGALGLVYAMMRLGGTDLIATEYESGVNYRAGNSRLLTVTKPGGGAWSIQNVDDVEIGVKGRCVLTGYGDPYCTSLVLAAAYGDMDIEVWPGEATAAAACPAPTIVTAAPPVVVLAVAATAAAAAPLPTVKTGCTIAAEATEAPASVPLPTVRIGETVAGEAATADAEAPLPSVKTGVAIAGELAVASASAPLPTIAVVRHVSVAATTALAPAEVKLATVLTLPLRLSLPMDEGEGATCLDESIYGNDGAITGADWVDKGDFWALWWNLEEVGQNVNCGKHASLNNLTQLTWEFWGYMEGQQDGGHHRMAIRKNNDDFDDAKYLKVEGDTAYQGRVPAATTPAWSRHVLSTDGLFDAWHHFAMTYDDDGDRKVRLYFNGQEVGSYTDQYTAVGTIDTDATQDLVIGMFITSWVWWGYLAEVRVHSRVLSAEEIQARYEEGFQSTTIAVVAAEASSVAPTPSAAIGASVAGEAATAGAEALLPVVGISKAVSAELATAPAEALPPSIRTSVKVSGEPATAATEALAPAIIVEGSVAVLAVAGEAPAAALLPTIHTEVTISAVSAEAVAEAPLPTVRISKAVAAEVAVASAEALLPVVAVSETVAAVAAGATAEALLASVAIGEAIQGEAATAVAAALLPAIHTDVKVSGEPAAAPASVPAPTIRIEASVEAVVTIATAEALLPTVKTGTTVAAVSAEAVAEALLPNIVTGVEALVSAEPAVATAAALLPTVTTTEGVVALAVLAEANATAPSPTIVSAEVGVTPVPPGAAFAVELARPTALAEGDGALMAAAEATTVPSAYAGADVLPPARAGGQPLPPGSASVKQRPR